MAFQAWIDERLLEVVAYGFVGGPTYQTTKVHLISGRTNRNAERSEGLHRYTAPYDSVKDEYHNEILSAFHVCLGGAGAFRFTDRADFQVVDGIQAISTGDTDETIQLVRPYTFGGVTKNRIITKPVDSTKYSIAGGYHWDAPAMAVTANDVPIAFAVDYDTGIITITAGVGDTIRATFDFDVPVYFEDDNLQFAIVNWKAHSTDITLVEDFDA